MAEPEKKEKKVAKVGPKATAAMTKDEPKEKSAKAPEKKSEKKDSKKKKKHGFSATHIEHHDDGSDTVRHIPEDGGKEVSYATPDLNGTVSGLNQNLGGAEEAPVEPPAGAAPAPAPTPQPGV